MIREILKVIVRHYFLRQNKFYLKLSTIEIEKARRACIAHDMIKHGVAWKLSDRYTNIAHAMFLVVEVIDHEGREIT